MYVKMTSFVWFVYYIYNRGWEIDVIVQLYDLYIQIRDRYYVFRGESIFDRVKIITYISFI